MSETTTTKQTLVDRLFAAGAHFGFQKSRRHPTVKPFLFGAKQGTDIFDLEKTADLLVNAKVILEKAGADGKTVIFVGTKDEAAAIVKEMAEKAAMPYVVNRWIGGMITNFGEIKKRLLRLEDLIAQGESGELERKYTKKERVLIKRELDKLMFNFGGIRALKKIPDLMVVVDPRHDHIAVTEATDMRVPTIGIMSSDTNLKQVTTPVVINDALRSSVRLALGELVDAYLAGRASYTPAPEAPRSARRPAVRA
jgi:small subunit ribosomal protein S2